MKKLIFLVTVVMVSALIYGYKLTTQNEMADKYSKPATSKEFKGDNRSDLGESVPVKEYKTLNDGSESKANILLMLINDTRKTPWSPYLWWKYDSAKPGQSGC